MSSRLALPDVESLRGRGRLLVCLGLLAVYGCATSSPFRAGERAEQAKDYDRAVVEYSAAVRLDPEDRNARGALQRAQLRASQQHFFAGRRLAAADQFERALVEYQLAAELNPTDAEVEAALRDTRQRLRTQDRGLPRRQDRIWRHSSIAPGTFRRPGSTCQATRRCRTRWSSAARAAVSSSPRSPGSPV